MLSRFPRYVLGVLLFINIIGYIDRFLLLGFSPQITKEMSFSDTQFGLLTGAVWVVSYGIMAMFCGSLADRYSRTRIIGIGMFIWSLCTAGSGLAENFNHMVVARFFVACGEAALVPAGTSLIADLFDKKHRSSANGLFFTGLPVGIGLALLLSGTVGAIIGWRHTFFALGALGTAIAIIIFFINDDARNSAHADENLANESAHGFNVFTHTMSVFQTILAHPILMFTMIAFICVHFTVAVNSFVPLWLVREMGAEPTLIVKKLGLLNIVFGFIGALCGGMLADWLVRKTSIKATLLPIISLSICLPLMVISRFSGLDQFMLFVGLSASFFMPFSLYGSTISILQQYTPASQRSTVVGFQMLGINLIAIAIGSFIAGWQSDMLAQAGNATPLKLVMLTFDGLTLLSLISYIFAHRILTRADSM